VKHPNLWKRRTLRFNITDAHRPRDYFLSPVLVEGGDIRDIGIFARTGSSEDLIAVIKNAPLDLSLGGTYFTIISFEPPSRDSFPPPTPLPTPLPPIPIPYCLQKTLCLSPKTRCQASMETPRDTKTLDFSRV
jgi:hypothetical protein